MEKVLSTVDAGYLVGGDKVEEVLWRDVVLSPQGRHEVATDFDDGLVYVDDVFDDLSTVVGRHERVVGRY